MVGQLDQRADATPAPLGQWERLGRRVLGRWGFVALALPSLIFLALVFFRGMFKIVDQSIGLSDGHPSLQIYVDLFSTEFFRQALWRTLYLAGLTTVGSVAISYPLAYFIARSKASRRTFYLILVLLPWLTSIVVLSFGWRVLLGDQGPINGFLMWLGVINDPIPLVFNSLGITIGLIHVLSPFMILVLLSSFMSLNPRLEEASAMLGGGAWQTFRRVIMPLTMPALITGTTVVFLLAIAAVVTPQLLGGFRDRTVAVLMYQQLLQIYNFQAGAAMAIVLILFTVPIALLLQQFEQRRRNRGA